MCVQYVTISTNIAAWAHFNASIAFRVSCEMLTDPIWLDFRTETTILSCNCKTLLYYTSVVDAMEEGTKRMTTRSLVGIQGEDMEMHTHSGHLGRYKKTSSHSGGNYGKEEDGKKKKHGDDESGWWIGDYLKLAQGFMNKKDGEGESEGVMGDYLKLAVAEGFLKKC
jgi:hypothetical protein